MTTKRTTGQRIGWTQACKAHECSRCFCDIAKGDMYWFAKTGAHPRRLCEACKQEREPAP